MPLAAKDVHDPQYDVAVVGAGLAGSSIAAGLAQRGWDVLLVERDRLPRHKVCGEFLSPEAQHSLANLHILEDVAALDPVPLRDAEIHTLRSARLAMPLPAAAWGISRHALDARLAAAAQRCGAEFRQGTAVTAVEGSPDGYTLRLRAGQSGEEVRARSVIMACGRHAAPALVAREQAVHKRGWRHCVGLKCHYRGVAMEPQVELYLLPGGYVGINPIEGDRANVCLLITYEAFQAAGRSLACILEAAAARHPQFASRLRGATAVPESECAVAPVDTGRHAGPWDAQLGIPYLGDTAAMIPPLAGDGMAMALRSAELCLEPAHAYLVGTMSRHDWGTAYTRAWRAEFEPRLRLGRALQRALAAPYLGDLLAGAGRRLPWAAELMLAGTRGRMA